MVSTTQYVSKADFDALKARVVENEKIDIAALKARVVENETRISMIPFVNVRICYYFSKVYSGEDDFNSLECALDLNKLFGKFAVSPLTG